MSSAKQGFEYGSAGIVGVVTPQSNPTVEPEMGLLLPSNVCSLTARLTGHPVDARQRFSDYLTNLEQSLDTFGAIKLRALGFACTATTYLEGAAKVDAEFKRISDKRGYPLISSAQAVSSALKELRAKRIAIFTPYPQWLNEEAIAFWKEGGFDVVAKAGIDLEGGDTLGIYQLRVEKVIEAVEQLDCAKADAVLLTGTGAPTLRALPLLAEKLRKPVLSSNLCLAWAMLRAIDHDAVAADPTAQPDLIGGWAARVAQN